MTILALKSLHLGEKKTGEQIIATELGIKYSENMVDNRFHCDHFNDKRSPQRLLLWENETYPVMILKN